MGNPGIELFINVCLLLIGLVVLQVILKAWDKNAKAKEAKQGAAQKAAVSKKKK